VEIATSKQDWDAAIRLSEKQRELELGVGLGTTMTRSLLCLADLYIMRGNADDLENAQTLFRQVISEFNEMGIGHYPEIAQDRLNLIQRKLHAQTLDHENMTRELRKARHVQESLLPEKPPKLPGWDLAVLLEPAHETSGDFYDFLMLPDDNLGLVIGDVTDKGTSAALFMALSRSLWRTFAVNYPTEPERTMAETNLRILQDTHGGLFITLLYGILNQQSGDFTYCSAGHHPAFLRCAKDGSVEQLKRTGIPLGVMEETTWKRVSIKIEKGDVLVLYTDGITDAQNPAEEFYGLERLENAIKKHHGRSAKSILKALRGEVRTWVGNAPQFDDITLMVVMREKE